MPETVNVGERKKWKFRDLSINIYAFKRWYKTAKWVDDSNALE